MSEFQHTLVFGMVSTVQPLFQNKSQRNTKQRTQTPGLLSFFWPIRKKEKNKTNRINNKKKVYRIFGFLHISLVTCNKNKMGIRLKLIWHGTGEKVAFVRQREPNEATLTRSSSNTNSHSEWRTVKQHERRAGAQAEHSRHIWCPTKITPPY